MPLLECRTLTVAANWEALKIAIQGRFDLGAKTNITENDASFCRRSKG